MSLLLLLKSQGGAITPLELDESLTAALRGLTALTSVVGANIFPEFPPQSRTASPVNLPWVLYQVDDEEVAYHLTGKGTTRKVRVTVDILGQTAAQRWALYEAVRGLLDNFTGTLGGAGGVYVAETQVESVRQEQVRLNDGSDRVARLASMQLLMWYTPP